MKRISRIELALLWICVVWLIIVLFPMMGLWMWSGLHPSSMTKAQRMSMMVPVQQLRDMDDRFRGERNEYFFNFGAGALGLTVVLLRITFKRDGASVQVDSQTPDKS